MREEIENILSNYAFEFNTPEIRREIMAVLQSYLSHKASIRELYDFRIEDRTELNENNTYFQIFYQLRRATEIMVMDISLRSSDGSSGIKISDFEKNLIGKRDIKKLKI